MDSTRIVAGLGNPGPRYERTRHNAGFRAIDELARRLGVAHWKSKDEALQAYVAARRVVLVKPLSFMNDSGRPLAKIAAWYKVPPASLLVISDDLDLPFGRLRMRTGGGSGGHNGLKSIAERFGEHYPRLRLGIGRGRTDTIDYVLSEFTASEERELPLLLEVAVDGVVRWLETGPAGAIQAVNGWRPAVSPSAQADSDRAS